MICVIKPTIQTPTGQSPGPSSEPNTDMMPFRVIVLKTSIMQHLVKIRHMVT